MIRKLSPEELRQQYLKTQQQVAKRISTGWGLLISKEEAAQRKSALLGEDGTELLSRLDFMRNLPASAFGHKPPVYRDLGVPRIEIITTVVGCHKGGLDSSLSIYLEANECYAGYRKEENADRTNFLTLIPRDKEGLWVDAIMETVRFESIANGYSPRLINNSAMPTP